MRIEVWDNMYEIRGMRWDDMYEIRGMRWDVWDER